MDLTRPNMRRTSTANVADPDAGGSSFRKSLSKRKSSASQGTMSSKQSLTKSSSTILTDSSGKVLSPKRSLTKSDATILTNSPGITLPPRKSTSIYSRYSISKYGTNLASQKSNASITNGPTSKGGKSKKKQAPKKTASKSGKVKKPPGIRAPKSCPHSKGKKSKPAPKPKREIFYLRGEFIALLAEDEDFYLAQVCQHVYDDTNVFRIRWLEKSAHPSKVEGEYRISYVDETEPECIITHVKMPRVHKGKGVEGEYYRLPESQERKIMRKLNEDEDSEESDEEEEEDDEEEDEEESDGEPESKKRKKSAGKKKKVVSTKAKKENKKNGETPKRRKLTPEERENPNLLLVKNDKVKVWEKDPFLEGKDNVPFISTNAHAKLVHRAVVSGDIKLLRSLVADMDKVFSVSARYSVAYPLSPLQIAMKSKNIEAIKILLKEIEVESKGRKKKRVEPTKCLLSVTGTGSYNYRSLGVPRIQKLTMSRGSKEGNNALLKDVNNLVFNYQFHEALNNAMEYGFSKTALDSIIAAACPKKDERDNMNHHLYGSVIHAVRNGHRKLAGQLVDECMKRGDTGQFNFLHRDVLLFNNEDLKSFREVSCKKKPWTNDGVTPIHCAAINPNVKYLAKLLSVLPEYNLLDRTNARPIHYAAACEGTAPLEFLLKKGVDPEEVDGKGMTALMIACKTGRAKNVKLLLDRAKEEFEKMQNEGSDEENEGSGDEENEEEGDEAKQANINKYGIGGINRPVMKNGEYYAFCPIHFAVAFNHMDVVEELIRHEVNLHKTLHNAKNKETPLMIACYHGNLDMVKLLIKNKARVEERDRLRRTPLIHACMNGRAGIASYLLHLGADPNAADSSGNTCLHYAAAYGWYHCIKVLLQAGADANKANEWKITPMWIAFLKGHVGLMDILLDQPDADINMRDEDGMTLLASACASPLVKGLDKQIKYLVEKRNADPNVLDEKGNNCLHHLAENRVNIADEKTNEEAAKLSESLANYLIKKGCNPAAVNENGGSPLSIAIWQDNIKMVTILINHTTELPVAQDKEGNNLLHNMAVSCITANQKALLDILLSRSSFHAQLKTMAQDVNDSGFTPLLSACNVYCLTPHKNVSAAVSGQNASGDDYDKEDEDEEEDEDEDDENSDEEQSDDGDDGARKRGKGKEQKKKGNQPKGASVASSDDATLEWTKEQQRMKEAREFIDTLIARCGSSVSETVQKKKVPEDTDTSNWKELDFYLNKDQAGWTPLFYMLGPVAEQPTKRKDGSVVEMCPGLTMMLKHNPDVNHMDLNSQTSLIIVITRATLTDAAAATAVKMLVEKGADMDHEVVVPAEREKEAGNHKLRCAINIAAGIGNVETVIYLAEKGADLHIHSLSGNNNVLHIAAGQDRGEVNLLPMVKALVERGANVNHKNSLRSTPLHVALSFNGEGSDGTADVESFLIDNGANVYAKDIFGRQPLHNVFAKLHTPFNNTRDDPIDLCTTLVASMRPDKIDECDKYEATALHYAARRGAGVSCMTLIQKGADINAKDGDGNTPLGLAAIGNHESCVILFLQRKADFSQSAIVVSDQEMKERQEKEQKLVKAGFEVADEEEKIPAMQWHVLKKKAEKERQPKEYSIFQACVALEWQGVVFMMLNELENVNFSPAEAVQAALTVNKYNLALTFLRKIKDKKRFSALLANGRTLFHVFAVEAKPDQQEDLQLRLAERLFEVGVPLFKKDKFGCSPLHYACLRHHVAFVRFIIGKDRSTNVSAPDNNRRTPLAAAIFGECLSPSKDGIDSRLREIVGELTKTGAKIDDHFAYDPPEFSSFGFRWKRTWSDVEKEYTEPSRINVVTSLILSINFENFFLTKYLLENKADINGADKNGKSAMMYAVETNDAHFVRLLLNPKYSKEDSEKKQQDSDEEEEEEEDDDEDDDEEEDDNNEDSDYDPESDDDDGQSKKRKKAQMPQGRSRGGKAPRRQLQAKISRRFFAHGGLGEDEDADEDVGSARKKTPKRAGEKQGDLAFWKNFIPTMKTSKVDVNAVDSNGKTALHYLRGPLALGSFENVEILKLLVDNKADLHKRDKWNILPIEQCVADAATNLVKAMKSFMTGAPYHVSYDLEEVMDDINWTDPPPDFRADAAAMLKKVDERKSDKSKAEAKKLKLDHVLDVKDGEVVEDSELGMPYDVVMMKIDVTKGTHCLYNFYKFQIVYDKKKKLYVLLNRWGRIGDEGQYQQTPFTTLNEAAKEFTRIFRAKTGNKWADVKNYVFHPNKYRLIPLEQRLRKEKEYNAIDFDLSSDVTSEMPQDLQDLMKEFSDVEGLKTALQHMNCDTQSMPVGRISVEYVEQAKKILSEMRPLVEKWEEVYSPTVEQRDDFHEAAEKISKLSNEYHYLVPSGEFAFEKVSPLFNSDSLGEAQKRVDNLEELELAGRLMAAAQFRKNDINPMDYIYRSLNCHLKSMEENGNDGLTQYLLQYIHAGYSQDHSKFVVERIFEVARDGEQARYANCKLDNQMLLFHGTKSTNLLSILSRGLLVTPIEANWTGRSFGDGIYFSDTFAKSYAYCHNFNAKSKRNFMLICQVKLGNVKEYDYNTQRDVKKNDSAMAKGYLYPDPKYNVTLPSGVVIPLGKLETRQNTCWGMEHSEYIIPNEEQVCIKYLVQLRAD